jgi:hypothetical protein
VFAEQTALSEVDMIFVKLQQACLVIADDHPIFRDGLRRLPRDASGECQ